MLDVQRHVVGDAPVQAAAATRGHAHLREARHQPPGCQQHARRNQDHPQQHLRIHRHAGEMEVHRRCHHVHRQVQAHARCHDQATEPERHGMMEGDAHRRGR